MTHAISSRRRFLSQLGRGVGLAGLAGSGLLSLSTPVGAAVNDYKALVCLFLLGGNDGDNTVLARDSARVNAYQQIRGGSGLGLSGAGLTATRTSNGQAFAFHGKLANIDNLYGQGQVAVMLNIGNLSRPLTKADYTNGGSNPAELFSHPDQQTLAQVGMGTAAATGWGGRLLDVLGTGRALDAVSVGREGQFVTGSLYAGNLVPETGGMSLSGMSYWPQKEADARRAALLKILAADTGQPVSNAANKALSDGILLGSNLQAAQSAALPVGFPNNSLGNQLKTVAQMIAYGAQQGPGRQVFYVSLGGFDTHGGQNWQHGYLLEQLDAAVNAFQTAMNAGGLAQKVTLFTSSEFGRTFSPNSGGTDHGWGSHAIVVGGAVKGGLYGEFPEFVLGGINDATTRGTWIPTMGFQQMGATLGQWFGATPSELENTIFPNQQLSLFPTKNLGFML